MRASAVPDGLIATILLDQDAAQAGERVRQLLDRAERPLTRSGREWRPRQALGYALRAMQAASASAAALALDPEEDPAVLRATIDFLEAIAAVLRAEPDEHRDFLPEHIRADPEREINLEVARIVRRIMELAIERKQALTRERTSARRRVEHMQTSDYARLSDAERAEWERRLGLELPDPERPAKSDALSRLPLSLEDGLGTPPA